MGRREYVLLFEAIDSNPNGDPDNGNAPRVDPVSGNGLVTDVCLKRKVRDTILLTGAYSGVDQSTCGIQMQSEVILNQLQEAAHRSLDDDSAVSDGEPDDEKGKAAKKGKKSSPKKVAERKSAARAVMCSRYFDVRTFGAMMETGEDNKCGVVRGPFQFAISRSIVPVVLNDMSITRQAITAEKDAGKRGTFGRKSVVTYGLYRLHIFFNPFLAAMTGFGESDLKLFLDSLKLMFEFDRSALRSQVHLRKLVEFEHSTPLGKARACELFDLVSVKLVDEKKNQCYTDYVVSVNTDNLPNGVKCNVLVD
jgi:CRISPR-associated protein Csd2